MITDRDLIAFMETPSADPDLAARIAIDNESQRVVSEQLRLDAALVAFHASQENKQRLRESILAELLPHGEARLLAAPDDAPPRQSNRTRNVTLLVLAPLLLGLAFAMFFVPRPVVEREDTWFGVVLDSPINAEVLREGVARAVTRNHSVHAGDRIITHGDDLLLGTPHGCVLSIGPATSLKLLNIKPGADGVSVELQRGELTVAVAGEDVEVITPHTRILLHSAKAHVKITAAETRVEVAEGEAILARDSDKDVLSVLSGHTAVANAKRLKTGKAPAKLRTGK